MQGPKRGGRPATSWVDCLQKKSRGLRRGPAQGQRTEVGRIRSCCQGWTGLDDCCEEHGQVAPGGREGSGSTRQRLATRGPSSIQRATPARG